jgi:hypothetical protein
VLDTLVGNEGMTLVELLVVVSINPRSHTAMALEARAKNNVSSVAEAVVACIAARSGDETLCDTWSKLYNGGFVSSATQPVGVIVGTGCVSAEEANSQYCKYQTSTEEVICNQASGC